MAEGGGKKEKDNLAFKHSKLISDVFAFFLPSKTQNSNLAGINTKQFFGSSPQCLFCVQVNLNPGLLYLL